MATRGSTSQRSSPLEGTGPDTRILLLHGKEQFLRTRFMEEFRDRVRDEGIETDTLRFDGRTADPAEVLDECRSMGLMMQHKLVVVDDADQFVKGDERRRMMERYAESPGEGTTLVLRSSDWNKGKLDKLIEKCGTIIKCDEPKPNDAASWCVRGARERHGRTLEPDAARLLIDRLGTDMGKLSSQIAKLSTLVEDGQPITRELVLAEVGMSKEERAWAIQDAVLTGDPELALTRVRELIEVSRVQPLVIRVALGFLALRLHGFAAAVEGGVRPPNIFPIRPPQAKQYLERLGRKGIAALLAEAVRADQRAKSGREDETRAVERLAIRFARALGG